MEEVVCRGHWGLGVEKLCEWWWGVIRVRQGSHLCPGHILYGVATVKVNPIATHERASKGLPEHYK